MSLGSPDGKGVEKLKNYSMAAEMVFVIGSVTKLLFSPSQRLSAARQYSGQQYAPLI